MEMAVLDDHEMRTDETVLSYFLYLNGRGFLMVTDESYRDMRR